MPSVRAVFKYQQYQSHENAPRNRQLGTRESRFQHRKIAVLRREVQLRVSSIVLLVTGYDRRPSITVSLPNQTVSVRLVIGGSVGGRIFDFIVRT